MIRRNTIFHVAAVFLSGKNSPNPSPNLSYRAAGYAPSIWLVFDEFSLRESNTWFLEVPLTKFR